MLLPAMASPTGTPGLMTYTVQNGIVGAPGGVTYTDEQGNPIGAPGVTYMSVGPNGLGGLTVPTQTIVLNINTEQMKAGVQVGVKKEVGNKSG